jgi:predicted metal-dependent peptidase
MEDPFFGHFLFSINREISEDGPTLWVRPSDDDKVIMGINPDFWSTELKGKNFRMGGIKHEVLHVVFKHLTRAQERSGGRLRYSNHKLFNIAADLVVNQYVERNWLIEGAVKLELFPDLNLRKEMDVSYYYDKLNDFLKEQMENLPQQAQGSGECPNCGESLGEKSDGSGGGDGEESEDGESDGSGGGDGESDGSGGGDGEESEDGESDGSGGGDGEESEDGESEGSGKMQCPHCGEDISEGEGKGEGEGQGEGTGGGSGSSESWSNLQSQFSQGPGARGGYHGFWGELDQSTESQREVLEEWVDRQIVNAVNRLDSTNTWGDLPGSLKDYLKEFMKTRKPKIDWRRNLRLFTENSQNTYLSNTLKRPSRRYKKIAHFPDGSPMYETKKGVPVKDKNGNFIPVWVPKYPGLKVRQRSRLLVAIDTSGSIRTEEDLPKFFNEMYHLQKKQVEILVVEVDEWIQRIYPFPLPEGQIEVKGRGGTDYNELIKYANGEEIDRSGTTKSYQRGHTYSKAAGITVWEKGNWVAKESIKLNKQIDGIVYFTDGQAATPFEVSKLPILWILAGIGVIDENSKSYNDLPGQKVKIED